MKKDGKGQAERVRGSQKPRRQPKNPELGRRLNRVLGETRWKMRELQRRVAKRTGDALGSSYSALRDLQSGMTTRPHTAVLDAIADEAGFCREWMATGEGPAKLEERSAAEANDLAAINRAHSGWSRIGDLMYEVSSGWRWGSDQWDIREGAINTLDAILEAAGKGPDDLTDDEARDLLTALLVLWYLPITLLRSGDGIPKAPLNDFYILGMKQVMLAAMPAPGKADLDTIRTRLATLRVAMMKSGHFVIVEAT